MTHEEPLQVPISTFKYSTLWLLAIVIIAFGLRIYQLDSHGIFFDEKATVLVSQGIVQDGGNQTDVFGKGKLVFTNQEFWNPQSYKEYLEASRRSDIGNSPFYYFLLHFWIKITNTTDFYVRFLSLIFGVFTVILTYVFTKRYFKSILIPLIAAFITAFEPFFITYSQQARNYSLTFFLTLLSSYFFLRLIENNNKQIKWLFFYGVISGLSLMSHFLAFTVLLGHGLYAMLLVRDKNTWLKLIIAGMIAILPIVWWFTFGAGDWTLRTLSYQSAVYLECALNRPFNNPYGIILPATIPNVLTKSIPIFSDLWIYANNLAGNLLGIKNHIFSIFIGGILIIPFYRDHTRNLESRQTILNTTVAILFLGSAFFYNNHQLHFLVLSVSILVLFLSFKFILKNKSEIREFRNNELGIFLVIMSLFPTTFLIFNAFRSGHTYGLTQRYSGFSFPFVIILATCGLYQLIQSKTWLRYVVICILLSQFIFISQTIASIYADVSPKYNYRNIAREKNPYEAVAQKIINQYKTGDTVFIPAPKNIFDNEVGRTFLPYSVTDAQYINLYLPQSPIFVQKLDTTQNDVVFLETKSGRRVILANLKEKRY